MCRICTDPVESLVEMTYLDCSDCPNLSSIPAVLVRLVDLRCHGCPAFASIPPELVRLERLFCYDCPLLASIPNTLTRLTYLDCHGCPLLASIPATLARLGTLNCTRCPCLLSIPSTFGCLSYLYCSYCPRLTSIPIGVTNVYCYGCPWLPQNRYAYPMHIPSLLLIQRWFRTGKKQVFRRVIRTRAFNEWIFHPERIGGKLVKRQMEAELDAMRPTKKQRVE
jgi:hypothetical protein